MFLIILLELDVAVIVYEMLELKTSFGAGQNFGAYFVGESNAEFEIAGLIKTYLALIS